MKSTTTKIRAAIVAFALLFGSPINAQVSGVPKVQPVGAASVFQGQQVLQPYAAAAALPANASKMVCFRNLPTSADFVYLGSSVTVTSYTGQPFAPGEGDCRAVSNSSLLFFATMAGATVAFDGVN